MEDRLQKFARVVETGSITKAARALHISQPALSTAIHKLERELKVQLIKHAGRTIEITAAGRSTYLAASAVRARIQDLSQELAELQKQKPVARIGMIDSLAELLCSKGDLLHDLEAIANTSLVVNNSSYLAQAVEQAKLDIALVAWQPRKISLQVTTLGGEPLVLVTRSDGLRGVQAQAKQGVIPNFLAYNSTSNTFRLIQAHFEQRGQHLTSIFHSTSPEVILQLVLAGRGVAVLPFKMVSEHLETGSLARVNNDIIKRPIVAVQEKNRTISTASSLCISKARQALISLTQAAADRH